jgi:hypothetical protein
MTQREMGYGSDDDVDMGSIHPGALSAMRRLQGEGSLDTRSYEDESDIQDEAGNYTPDAKGRLVGTARQRNVTRSELLGREMLLGQVQENQTQVNFTTLILGK